MMMVALILVCTVQHMKIRSLVLARDDASLALCCYLWIHTGGIIAYKNYRLMLLLLFPNSHSWLDQESYDDGGTYPSLHCTAHEDKVPGPCQG